MKNNLGQYFTINNELQQFVFDKVKYKNQLLLEPSFGAGHLIKKFIEYNKNYKMVCCEIDNKIEPIVELNQNQVIIYNDFTNEIFLNKFKTIIGNPPYIKNIYVQFIELCFELLDTNGELIMIVPSIFFKLTSASILLQKMISKGSFTDVWFPNNEKLFDNANIDVVLFRYERDYFTSTTMVNNIVQQCNINDGIITFNTNKMNGVKCNTLFNVYVGIVSGKDSVYKSSLGNIKVLVNENKLEQFIYTSIFPTTSQEINNHLELHKVELINRKIRKFNEKNWFEWGALRNINTIQENFGKDCIYIKNLTRNKTVAFIGKVQYFSGSLLCLIPKNEINLLLYIDFLNNNEEFKKEYTYSGRFKLGQKQCLNIIFTH